MSRTSVAWKPKTADPRPAPALAPTPDPDEGCAWRRPAWLPIPPVRPAGRGRALLLLPLEQVSRASVSPVGGDGGGAAAQSRSWRPGSHLQVQWG